MFLCKPLVRVGFTAYGLEDWGFPLEMTWALGLGKMKLKDR